METIFLEQWLHNLLRQKAREDPEYRQFLGQKELKKITRSDIDDFHLFKLKKILSYVYERSSFYKELFDKNGISPSDFSSLADLARLPFTEPSQLAQNPNRFLCVSLGEIARATTFTTSGTTGPQKQVFCTDRDLETMTDFMGIGIRTVANSDDVVQIMLPNLRPNDQADLLAKGVRKIGAKAVISGTAPSSEEQLAIARRNHSTVLFGSTSRIYRITQETCQKQNLKEMGVKTLFVTSEYLSESMRRRLKDVWNCDVHCHYGLTEMGLGVAVECHAHNGFHFNEADLIVEVVDPETGAVLDKDQEGEMVFTTLSREATPLIRYRTHDISRLIGASCECGASTLQRIAKTAKRLEAIVKIGEGDEIHPTMFDELLYTVPSITDYQIALGKQGDKDYLSFKIEVYPGGQDTYKAIEETILQFWPIRKNMNAGKMALPTIELLEVGALKRTTRAKKLIVDKRSEID